MSQSRIGPAPPRADWLRADIDPRRSSDAPPARPKPGFGLRNDVVIEAPRQRLAARAAHTFNWMLALIAAVLVVAAMGVLIQLIYPLAFAS
jgi:hypothetical protein